MQNCLCVCAAAAGGTKYRGVCSDQRGDVGIAPYATRRDVSFIIVGADAHVGPAECTDFTVVCGKFVPSKRADVGICPYSAEAGAFFK